MALFHRYLIAALIKLLLLIFLAVVFVESDSWCEENNGIQWHLYGTRCYGVAETETDYGGTKSQCNSFGGAKLADVNPVDIRTFVRTHVIPAGGSFWVDKISSVFYTICQDIHNKEDEPEEEESGSFAHPTCNALSPSDEKCIDCRNEKKFICEKAANFKNTKKCSLDPSVSDKDWDVIGRNCYCISRISGSWLNSASHCKSWFNATLALADEETVRNGLVRLAKATNNDIYLWVNSTKNINNENCFAVHVTDNGKITSKPLSDFWCGINYRFSCAVPLLD